ESETVMIAQRRTYGRAIAREGAAPCMAGTAHRKLIGLLARTKLEQCSKRIRGARRFRATCPGCVSGSLAMAGFARDGELGPMTRIGLRLRIEFLFKSRLVALGTARLPILVRSCPMQPVSGSNLLVGIEVVPSFLPHIPGDIECLQAPLFGFYEILLQRAYANCVPDLKFGRLTVRTIGFD